MAQHTGKVSVAVDKIRWEPGGRPSTFWAVFIETRRVVVFHEKTAKTGLVREETTVGAHDEGVRGLLGTEETKHWQNTACLCGRQEAQV